MQPDRRPNSTDNVKDVYMKIVVLMKEVPDTYGNRILSLETGLADRAASEPVLDEIGERALEAALSYADRNANTQVVVLSMAPEASTKSLRKALAMGADSAIHLTDELLVGADLGLTAESIAGAIRRAGFTLVIAGNNSTDGSAGVLPAMIAERLGVPHLTSLSSAVWTEDTVGGERAIQTGVQRLSSALPAVISVTESFPEARFPSFRGIVAAKKKPIETVSLTDIGISPGDDSVSRSIVISVRQTPRRLAGIKIVDDGNAGEKLAEYLASKQLG